MGAKFLDHNKKEPRKRRRRRQRELQKKQNNKFARASRFLAHFLAIVARLRHELPNFTRPLNGESERNTKVSFSFYELIYGPFGFNPRKFRQHLTN